MDPEKYSLKWRSHSDHLMNIMREMMMNEEFSDVTLVTEDKKHLKAHKNILSASSPVFKDMLKTEMTSKLIIYLRGIISSELEAILQFIYLGEATFCEERIDEFLAVAKSLEIKELYTAITVTKNDSVDDPLQSNQALVPEESKKQIVQSNPRETKAPQQISKVKQELVGEKRQFNCEQCKKVYLSIDYLKTHIQGVHEGSVYSCDQCEFETVKEAILTTHIRTKHEGLRFKCKQCQKIYLSNDALKTHIRGVHEGLVYSCDQCEFKSAKGGNLTTHIRIKHEGVRFPCDQCDYQSTLKNNLKQHILSKHEGVRFPCDWCEYQARHPSNLRNHIKKYHLGDPLVTGIPS